MAEAAGVATGRIVVVTGPPGAGKTTVARLVADAFDLSVHVQADWFWKFIARGWVAPWEPAAQEQNEAVIHVLAGTASRYAAAGYETVVDGIIGPWFVDAFLAGVHGPDAAATGVPAVHYVILRPSYEVAWRRATDRGDGELVEEGPIAAMFEEFAELGAYEPHVVDSSALEPDQTANRVLQLVERGDVLLGRSQAADTGAG